MCHDYFSLGIVHNDNIKNSNNNFQLFHLPLHFTDFTVEFVLTIERYTAVLAYHVSTSGVRIPSIHDVPKITNAVGAKTLAFKLYLFVSSNFIQ